MTDVARAELGVDVIDRSLRASRFESGRVRDRPVGHVATVADADDTESFGVDERIAAEGLIEARHDVAEVAAAPVADAGATERLAVALTAARVRVDQNIPGPRVHLELVRVGVTELPMGPTMDPEQRRISFPWIEVERLHDPTVDVVVVPAIDEAFRLRG